MSRKNDNLDVAGKESFKKQRYIDNSHLFINKKKLRELEDIPAYMFKDEEQHNSNNSNNIASNGLLKILF